MGDRANIYIVDRPIAADDDNETQGIYLYTHWNGCEWPEMLRKALNSPRARRRWTDDSYLIRILTDQLFESIRDEETGGGISTQRTSGEYPVIVVDVVRGQVSFAPEGTEEDRHSWRNTMSFDEFCALHPADYPAEML